MKLHRPVAEHVISALKNTFGLSFGPEDDGRAYYADKVLERIFKNSRQLGSRDRKLIAEGTYEIVRWWRKLLFAVGADESQVRLLDVWRVFGAWLLLNGETHLPEWTEFRGLDQATLKKRIDSIASPAIQESIPDWIQDIGAKEIGEKWPELASALNQPAPLSIRANRLRTTRDLLRARLKAELAGKLPAEDRLRILDIPGTEDGLYLTERKNLFATEAFKLGHFELQDSSSQGAAVALAPEPGERVIDACAGAGGKTLHMAAMMGNKGKIYSLDIFPRKLDELRRRCTRAGVDIAEARLIEGKALKRLAGCADKILLDVPCSGLGVLRRNPDTKWKLREEELDRLRALQIEILSTYSAMAKPHARLVYATCSVLPSENGDQVRKFLQSAAGSTWKLIEEHQAWPKKGAAHFPSGDGFYTAVMER